MGLSVTTIAQATRLTTRAAVKAELGQTGTTEDTLLDQLIDFASAGIVSYCGGRRFAREAVTETLPGFGGIHLQLARTPVISVASVSQDSNLITDYSIEDRDRGWLYRRGGWAWTAQTWPGLSGGGGFLDMGTPLARQEEPQFSVAYTAGYVLPSQNVSAVTVSAAAADNSFNDSASGFPALLKAGDVVDVGGFVTAGNNGRFLVSGTPTTSKIVVSGTLTLEAEGAAVTVRFQPPAECRPLDDVEKAAIETVKSWWHTRKKDPAVFQEMVGSLMITYAQGSASAPQALPPSVVGLLRPWVRRA